MPDWHRIIVGDAFKASSRSFNYYRDMALLWPFLLFSIGSIIHVWSPEFPAYRVYGFKLAACAIVAILLAKEKLIMLAGALAFVTFRLAVALVINWNSGAFLALLITGVILIALLQLLKGWKPSFEYPEGMNVLDLLVGLTSLGLTLALAVWMRP